MKSVSVLLCAVLFAASACCARDPRSAGGASQGTGVDAAVVVVGTVVDAASGDAVAEARVKGPRGVKAVTDEKGKFELKGLEVGDEGEVVVTTDDRRRGSVVLRKLRGGVLEVVVHVEKVKEER